HHYNLIFDVSTILFQDRLDQDVLKLIVDALNETIQCPVCLGTLRPPLTQCSSGHALCPDCKPQINICPTCRKDFIETKPVVLQQLLDALPRMCLFRTLGCPEVFIPGGTHETLCSYRTVDCKLLDCEWSGQAKKLESHLTVVHNDRTVVLEDETASEIVWRNFNNTEDSFKYIPFVAYGQVFWEYIHMNVEVQKLCISFTRVGNGHTTFKYFAIISFKHNIIGYTYTIKVPIDNNKFVDFYEEHCMTVPGDMLPRFVNQESLLVYSVQIIREDD
ncbi:E3 ubiquitin-protein ligase SINA-like 11, partial [Homalodisca vitripennis]|uniref:E3 ubiquitin-protein ligase SINA-like 11 n=1 Tax=Homalodisca vitripennis TaxID=197043 RepID=UPI001EE9FD01